jgi:hypothetical protein
MRASIPSRRRFPRVRGALAAPSANRFGRVGPARAHVIAEFGDALPIVLEGGDCEVGLESTIVDLSREGDARILRPGVLGRAALESILGPMTSGATPESPRAAGTLASHYAPRRPWSSSKCWISGREVRFSRSGRSAGFAGSRSAEIRA